MQYASCDCRVAANFRLQRPHRSPMQLVSLAAGWKVLHVFLCMALAWTEVRFGTFEGSFKVSLYSAPKQRTPGPCFAGFHLWFPSAFLKVNGSPNCPKISWILSNDFWIYHFTHLDKSGFWLSPPWVQRISSDFVVSGLCPKVVTNFWTGNSGPQEIWSLLIYKLPKKLTYIPAWDKENHRLGKGY